MGWSEYRSTLRRYQRQGMTVEEATRAAERDLLWQPGGWRNGATASDVRTDEIPLTEATSSGGTRREIRLITPGWGASGYYHASVLAEFGPDFIPAGTQMFLDHPTWQEEQDRPERSVRDLAGVTNEDARWEANHDEGPGLFAEATIFEHMAPLIEELAPHIGVSVRGRAETKEGEAEGQTGPIIQQFIGQAHSVDFVTRAERGGKIIEAYRLARQQTPGPEEGRPMNITEARRKVRRERERHLQKLEERGLDGRDAEFYERLGVYPETARTLAGETQEGR